MQFQYDLNAIPKTIRTYCANSNSEGFSFSFHKKNALIEFKDSAGKRMYEIIIRRQNYAEFAVCDKRNFRAECF